LYQDRDGNVWVGMRGGLLRLSETSFETAGPLAGITNEGVRTAAVGQDGDVWVATGHGLNRFSGGARTTYAIAQTLALHRDRRGTMWVATSDQFGRLNDGKLVPVPVAGLPQSRVMAIADGGDRLWLCTAIRGLMTWDGTALARFEDTPDVGKGGCQAVISDRQDRVWIGFMAGGISVYDRGVFRHYGEADGVPSGTVLSILEAKNGAIWLATSGGVSRYQNGRFTPLTRTNAPLASVVPVLVEDDEGYIWVGVNSGAAVLRFHPGEVDKVAGQSTYRIEYALYDETDGMQRG
jgi:ligand-binding sensor domain-containing protein